VTLDRLVLIGLVALVVVALVWSAWCRARRGAAQRRPSASLELDAVPSAAQIATLEPRPLVDMQVAAEDDVLVTAARVVLRAGAANPLSILAGLRLEDALDVGRYAEAVALFERRRHHLEFDLAGRSVTVVTHLGELARSGKYLTFELTSSIRSGIAQGTLRLVRDGEGKLLAMVRDARTGKVTDLLRGAPSGARLGALTGMVYGLAHLVSAKDLAAKLDALTGTVDLLLALRGIDQRARLEAVYARAKELAMQPLDATSYVELRNLRHEVRELRQVWRGEALHGLASLRDPPLAQGWRRRLPGTRAKHVAIRTGIGQAVGRVVMMEFALRLEHLLAVASEDAETFLQVLADDLGGWEELADLLEARAQAIGFEELRVEPYAGAVREVVRVYREAAETRPLMALDDAPADDVTEPQGPP
jgi:hypothetical protein